jgi:hypothetical protein
VQGVCAALHELGAEAVASDVHHAVLVGQRRDGALWVFGAERIIQEDEIGEAPSNGGRWLLEGGKVGLGLLAWS